jgi:hypothetical protein
VSMSLREHIVLIFADGSNLQYYHEAWSRAETSQPFQYWLDFGEGKVKNCRKNPSEKLRCASYRTCHCRNARGRSSKASRYSVLLYSSASPDGQAATSRPTNGSVTKSSSKMVASDGHTRTLSTSRSNIRPSTRPLGSGRIRTARASILGQRSNC